MGHVANNVSWMLCQESVPKATNMFALSTMSKHERNRTERLRVHAHADRSKEWHGKIVLAAMPVVARSQHAVVSEWGYGEAGLLKLKLNKRKGFAGHGMLRSIPVATHTDFVARWIAMYIPVSYHFRGKVHCVNYCCDCY